MKGKVMPLSSLFPAEEAQKAVKRVQDTIAEKRKELDRLQGFTSDNTNLINLVQRLPDQLHHDIMEGLIEIREDYVNACSLEQVSSSGSGANNTKKVVFEDEEFAQIMAKLDELAAESNNESDGDEKIKEVLDNFSDLLFLDEAKISKGLETRKPPKQAMEKSPVKEEITNRQHYHDKDPSEKLTGTGLTVKSMCRDKVAPGNILSGEKTYAPPDMKTVEMLTSSSYEAPPQISKSKFDPQKAFTGSIIERTGNHEIRSKDQISAPSNAQPSKPVSKFKRQRK